MSVDTKKLCDEVRSRAAYLKEHWHDKVKAIPAIYQGDKADEVPFNILYSNTETIVPALFSQIPQPVVRRRFGEARGDLPAQASERMLSYLMDTNLADYPPFVEGAESAVFDAALPGQGQLRVRLVGRTPVIDYVGWDKFIWGFARRWEEVPWVAYQHDLTKKDIQRIYGLSAKQLKGFPEEAPDTSRQKDEPPETTFPVFEVFFKETREVFFLSEHVTDSVLLAQADPLGLNGFFPSPQPLTFLRATRDTLPRPIYNLYRQQAEELNTLTTRIKKIVRAIRVRGIYNGQLKELSQIFSAETFENALIPAESPALLERGANLDDQIWMVPNDKLVAVLRELVSQRELVKSTIYEILGIGDILRGVSRASETLGAQKIKDKWGSLRVTKLRERTARFLRDTLRLTLEVAVRHVPEEEWAAITHVQAIPSVQADVLRQEGKKPSVPSWAEVLGILRDDVQRSYIIDIEVNSTVDAEASDEKAQIAEFMTGLGQALQSLMPIAQTGPQGFEAVKSIVLEFCKKFRIASDVLRVIEGLQAPQQGGIPPEVQQQLQQQMQEIARTKEQLAGEKEALASKSITAEKQMLAAQKKLDEAALLVEKVRVEIAKQNVQMEAQKLSSETVAAEAVEVDSIQVLSQAIEALGADLQKVVSGTVPEMQGAVEKMADSLQNTLENMAGQVEKLTATQEQLVVKVNQAPRAARFKEQPDGSVIKEYLQ